MIRIFLIFCVVSCAFAVGEKVELYLGGNIKTWTRKRFGETEEEYISYCGPTETGIRCYQFVTESGKVVNKNTVARVKMDGTLVIYSINKSDAGDYYSNDEPLTVRNEDGTPSIRPRTVYQVVVN